ncbi:hypothetical protein [Alteribacillus sp. HJP-4]
MKKSKLIFTALFLSLAVVFGAGSFQAGQEVSGGFTTLDLPHKH